MSIVDLAKDLINLSGLDEDEVPIVFTGVRPGEKLDEVLFDPGMQTVQTSHPQVLQVVGPDVCVTAELDRIVSHFEDAAWRGDRVAINTLLGQIIPGFLPYGRLRIVAAAEAG